MPMMHRVLATLAFVAATPAFAQATQSLEQRIAVVREGTVHLSYASRPGVCGDGRETVRVGSAIVVLPSMFAYGRSDMRDCFAGPVRVAVGRSDGETVSLRVHVGGLWGDGDHITDLGVVSAPEAARYFLREAAQFRRRNVEYALGAAVFADSIALWPDLIRFARNADIRDESRHRAVFWIATYDDPAAMRALRELASDRDVEDELRGAAIVAMGRDDITEDDVAWLRGLYPSASPKLRDNIFLAVSRSDSPRAGAWLAEVASSADESQHTRQQAMFWLGQGRAPTADLLKLYGRIREPELRNHYTFVLSQRHDPEALDKLIDVAQHDSSREVRKQALFWLGQSKDPRAAQFLRDLVMK